MIRSPRDNRRRALTLPVLAVAGASLVFAACSSSSKSTTSSATNAPPASAGPTTTAGGSSASDAAATVKVANIAGVGNVLVDGNGRTLYILQSEKGGKVTCTSSGGCTNIWPPVVVPSGIGHGIAGTGVQASLLGSVMSPSGDERLTYGGWPLYTFSSDTGPGQAKGQGVKDVYGLWWALNPSGNPVTTAAASSSPTTSSSGASSGGAGF